MNCYITPGADNGAPGAEQIPFGLAHCSNVRVHEFSFLASGKADKYALLVGVGDIVPDALVAQAGNFFHLLRYQAYDPVKVMASPVKGGAA